MTETDKTKKQLMIFVLVTYGAAYLMGILMWYGSTMQVELSIFPATQMLYPAAGVMLAYLLTKWEDSLLPKWFYLCFLLMTLLMILFSILSLVVPGQELKPNGMEVSIWRDLSGGVAVGGSIFCWIALLIAGKERRTAYGLRWKCGKTSLLCILLFFVLYLVRTVVAYAVSGQMEMLRTILSSSVNWSYTIVMPIGFFLTFVTFFGEEYGWRYYLQPILQKRFGMRGGVLLLGVAWGLWHIFLDFFYYMPSGPVAVIAQVINCVFLSIFFAWTYLKTDNVWVPAIMHFMNNSLSWMMVGRYSQKVLENQQADWGMVLETLFLNGVVFGFFLLSKEFRKKD